MENMRHIILNNSSCVSHTIKGSYFHLGVRIPIPSKVTAGSSEEPTSANFNIVSHRIYKKKEISVVCDPFTQCLLSELT
jgi:hypothetical protein